MTQDSDDRPDQAEVEGALDTLLETVESVPPILSGEPVDVTCSIKVHNAMTPQEAVDQFMLILTRRGSDEMFFVVEDDTTDERYAIKGGVFYDPDEFVDDRDADE